MKTVEPVASTEAWERFAPQRILADGFTDGIFAAHLTTDCFISAFSRFTPRSPSSWYGALFSKKSASSGLIRGSYSDFEWGMRMSLRENIVHVPRKLCNLATT